MFEYKHEIKLRTNQTVSLFGEGYFADKSTFWHSHQSQLNILYDKVIKSGFPILIKDLEDENTIIIDKLEDFHLWLKSNQPFDFEKVNGIINVDKIVHLTCGIFNSNSWNKPKAYRIYIDRIEEDNSGNYWSQRFSKNGYQFKGEIINTDELDKVLKLFSDVPVKCFELELPRPNTPGNKDEYVIYIQIALTDGRKTEFKIDEYDSRDLNIAPEILIFKDKVKRTIQIIEKVDNKELS